MGNADIGVLFVHGIGEQTPGRTLVTCSEAIVDWFGAAENASAHVIDATLTPTGEEPAHLHVEVALPDGSQRRLLLAEAFWADAFPAPAYRELAGWLIRVAPELLLVHWLARVSTVWRRVRPQPPQARARPAEGWFGRVWASANLLLLLLVLVPLLMAVPLLLSLILLLVVVGAIPFGPLRQSVQWVQAKLSGVVGDSQVFVSRPVRESAILTVTRRSLSWVRDRAQGVVVVAHSQGAVVAHRLQRGASAQPIDTLVTYGSGLNKLGSLSRAGKATAVAWLVLLGDLALGVAAFGLPAVTIADRRSFAIWLSAAVAAVLAAGVIITWPRRRATVAGPREIAVSQVASLVATVCLVQAFEALRPDWLTVAAGVGVASLVFAFFAADALRRAAPDEVAVSGASRWVDIYADADPVPNGPLALSGSGPGQAEPIEIENLGIWWRDHSGYWTNRDVFVPMVVREILQVAHAAAALELDAAIEGAMKRRRLRVRAGVVMRTSLTLAAAAVLALRWDSFTPSSRVVRDSADVAKKVPGVPDWSLRGSGGAWTAHAVAVTFVLAGLLLAFGVVRAAAAAWTAVESRARTTGAREAVTTWPPGLFGVAVVWLALLEFAGLAAFAESDAIEPAAVESTKLTAAAVALSVLVWGLVWLGRRGARANAVPSDRVNFRITVAVSAVFAGITTWLGFYPSLVAAAANPQRPILDRFFADQGLLAALVGIVVFAANVWLARVAKTWDLARRTGPD